LDPTALRKLLQELCDDLDRGRPVKRWRCAAGGGLVLAGLVGGLQACDGDAILDKGEPDPAWEDCANGTDDDGDGDLDCADSDCHGTEACPEDTADTGLIEEQDCADKIDNDGDGDVDCADSDCADDPACEQAGAYGAPPVRS